MFTAIRKSAIVVLTISVGAFAFLGILSIWEVLDKEDVYKALTSIGIIAFACFLIVMVALEREGKLWQQFSPGGKLSGGSGWVAVLAVIIFLWILIRFFVGGF